MEGFIKGLIESPETKKKMEGLIKGLIDVAIGNHNQDDQNNNNNNNNNTSSSSRSSWAQVASGDDDEEKDQETGAHNYKPHPRYRKEEDDGRNEGLERPPPPIRRQQMEEGDGRNEDWDTVGQRPPPRRHQKEEDDGRNEDWETVGQRPPSRRHQKEEDDGRNEDWETVGQRPPQRRHQKVSMDHWQAYKQPPSEQEYSNEVDFGTDIEPSEEELADLSRACNKLWELDINRLVPGKDYEIDCGEGKKTYQKQDMAQGNLFSWLSDNTFKRPTYSRFCSLLDNYNPNEGCKETVTSQERQEQASFIEEISRTAPIKYLHKYLVSKEIAPARYEDFKRMMTDLWFELYSRGGTSNSSSAFEHVFVGEIKQEQEVSGFHNWIQFYLEEAKGRVDYQGYIFPRRRGQIPDSETQLLTVQFEWNGVLKSLSSTLIGVSPEFEIALFTLCFYLGEEDNHIQLGPYPVNIKCYRLGRDKIGSVFPIAES